jgi:hypothetical protein
MGNDLYFALANQVRESLVWLRTSLPSSTVCSILLSFIPD